MTKSIGKSALEETRKAINDPKDPETKKAKGRIRRFADKHKVDLMDLMDWYKDDLKALGEVPMAQFTLIVQDYVDRRAFYRRGEGEIF